MEWIPAILAIGVLIVVHETGHYVVARLCGMKVEKFSIGFGPAIASWTSKKTGTKFQLAPIPFGGFVEIKGMNILEEVDANDATAYPNRPAWQRFLTIFAGPATNYLFAVVLAFTLFMGAGMLSDQDPPPPRVVWKVDESVADAPAAGKIFPGDYFLAVNGQELGDKNMPEIVDRLGGQPITFTVRRKGEPVDVTLTPIFHRDILYAQSFHKYMRDPQTLTALVMAQRMSMRWRIGIVFEQELPPRVKVGVGTALKESFVYPIRQTTAILTGLKQWITGEEEGELGSVVRITSEVKKAIEHGWIAAILLLMVLNVYLGLFNLFPLPALDGGRLVFLGYEMVTRRRANPKLEATIHMVGVLVLAVLLVVVTVNDCRSL
jgi:regulator of sigma E protease